MTEEPMKKAVYIKENKWTPGNDVDVMHDGPELAFDLNQDFSNLDPRELARHMALLIAEIPSKEALIEDVLVEARATADTDGEAYSRPLIMSSVQEALESANDAIDDIPEEFHGAIQHAMDYAFSAGQNYQYTEFREKFLNKIENGKESREVFPSDGGNARAANYKHENTDLIRQMDKLLSSGKSENAAARLATEEGFGAQDKDFLANVNANRGRYRRNKAKAKKTKNC